MKNLEILYHGVSKSQDFATVVEQHMLKDFETNVSLALKTFLHWLLVVLVNFYLLVLKEIFLKIVSGFSWYSLPCRKI